METLKIHGIGSEMQGVGRLADGRAVFVPGALPSETCEVEITRSAKNFCEARLLRVVDPSNERTTPDCPVYGLCGGCKTRHMHYENALTYKHNRVYDALVRIGKIDNPTVFPTIGSLETSRTRNKAEYACENGVLGVYAAGSKKLIPLTDCLLQNEHSISALRLFAERLPHWAECRHIKGLVTRVNRKGELMLVLTGDAPIASALKSHVQELCAALPELVSLSYVFLNRRPVHALDGALTLIWGKPTIEETLLGLDFAISPQSFFQVNTRQTEVLYKKALEAADIKPGMRILDAYCGAGTITLAAAKSGAFALGVEIVPPAIKNANLNAINNHLEDKARFVCADAAKEIPKRISAGEHFDAVILDPPRKGADRALLESIAKARIPRISYVSCDPGTLARDCKFLCEQDYTLEWAQPVDMFPMTHHVETVVLLSLL